MRRLAALVLVVVAATGGVAGGANPSRRIVEERYAPNPERRIVVGTFDPGLAVAMVSFVPRPNERAVEVELTDDLGGRVEGLIYQGRDSLGEFCGATDDPVPIHRGQPVDVIVMTGECGGAVAVASRGTARVTFLRGEPE